MSLWLYAADCGDQKVIDPAELFHSGRGAVQRRGR